MLKRNVFFAVLLLFGLRGYSLETCRAVASIGNDLWLVTPKGELLERITFDGLPKDAASPSPDGKYLAYCPEREVDGEMAIFILTAVGQQVAKIVVDPPYKPGSEEYWGLRWMERLKWVSPTVLMSEANMGLHASCVDLWQIGPSFQVQHLKRIPGSFRNCEPSPGMDRLACIFTDEFPKAFGEPADFAKYLEIRDITNKAETSPRREYYYDPDPVRVRLGEVSSDAQLLFSSDGKKVYLLDKNGNFQYDLGENKLQPLLQLPEGLKVPPKLPEFLKVQLNGETLEGRVLNLYCEEEPGSPGGKK
jgi:hypothetical protein